MRNQQPGLPQPWLRQQTGVSDVQLRQQHFIYKQIQELQRQQQLQQLDQEARQQNSLNPLSAVVKQAPGGQSSSLVNGAPLQDASNYMWAGQSGGGDSRIPSTSQMHMVGNTNWVHHTVSPAMQGFPNGLTSSQEQNQALHSMSFGSQQLDQSLFGAPVATTRGALNQYSHFHGNSNDGINMLTKASDNQVDKTIMQTAAFNVFQNGQAAMLPNQVCVSDGVSVSNQGFQGKNLFGHVPVSTLHNGTISENFQQMNSLSRNVQVQELHDGQGRQVGWEGNLQEKAAAQVETSQGFVALDPTEAKILFNTDGGFWDNSLGKIGGMSAGGCVSGNLMEGNDHLNSFPSVHSGSWSALMQSAVAEVSSSDTGLQDEWSALSFQKTEHATENRAALNDSGKQPVNWVDNDFQTASSLTSRPFPLFDDSNMSLNGHCVTDFRQNASHESLQQSPKETSKWLDQSSQHKSLIGGSFQVQMPMRLDNTQERAWGSQIYEQSRGSEQSANMELNSRNKQSSWAHQQSMTSYNINNQSSIKQNGWNINESLSPKEEHSLKILDNENGGQHTQNNEGRGGMHLESDYSRMGKSNDNINAISFPNSTGGFKPVKSGASSPHTNPYINNFSALPNSSTFKMSQEMNQRVQHSHNLDYRKHAMPDLSFYRNNENVGKHQHESSQCLNVQESSISTSDRTSGESYGKKRESYQKDVSDSYNISSHSHAQHSTVGDRLRENACSVTMDTRPMVSGNQKSVGQVSQQSTGSRKFQYHPMGNSGVDMEFSDTTKHVAHTQDGSQLVIRGLKSQEQGYFVQSKSIGHDVSNIDMDIGKGYLPDVQRNAKKVEELPLRSVHPGYESSVSAPFDRSTAFYTPNERTMRASQNMLELLHKVDQSKEKNIVTGSSPDHNSSEMPEASAAQLHHSQSSGSQGFGLRLAPPHHPSTSNHGLPSQTSSQTTDDLNSMHDQEGNSSGAITPGTSFPRNRLPQQHVTSSSGQLKDQFLNLSFASQTDMGVQSKPASHFRLMHDSHNGTEQSAQASFPGAATRTLPFNLGPTADARGPFVQSYSSSAVHSQPTNVNSSYLRGSGQQVPISQLPVTSGTSHVGFSSVLQNARTNATSQQHLPGGLSGKVPLFQSIHTSASSMEAASWTLRRSDDLGFGKGGNSPSEIGTCSTNSEQFTQGDGQPGKDRSLQQLSHGRISMAQETAGSVQEQEIVVHPCKRNLGRGMPGQEYSISQAVHASPQNTENPNNEIVPFVRSLRSSGDTHQEYSLPHQMQAIEGVDPDSCRVTKRFKRADFGVDARESVTMTGSRFAYGPSTMARNPVENELRDTSEHVHFPSSDSKMLCFSSEVKEDRNTIASHVHVGGTPSKDMTMFGRNGPQNYSCPLTGASAPSFKGNEHPHIDSQMAPSWFERYGTYKNGQILPVHEGVDGFQRDAKLAAQHFIFGKVSEASHTHTTMEQANAGSASQTGSIWHSPVDTVPDNEHLSSPPLPLDQDLVIARANKRKSAKSVLIPWHKEVIECSQKLQNISMAELDWAQAANRLIEKVEDEAEMVEDGPAMPRSRRRIILTTQLMQQLLRAIPAAILSADASSEYESAAYFSAKLALGDACSSISGSGSDSHVHSNCGTMISGIVKASKRQGDQFLRVVEDFINRGRKLENDLLRLDKKASILDIRIECQDLEKISVINRFARFHGRGNADGVESSSSSDQKSCPLRYVTALPLPRDLPEEVPCLSL